MDKHQWSSHRRPSKQRKAQEISIVDIRDNLIAVSYPYNADLCAELIRHQDQLLKQQYHSFHSRLPQLLIQLDGVSDVDSDCKDYILSKEHQELYESVAFVLSKGNMSVLERHYLEQLFSYRSQRSVHKHKRQYPIGVFSAVIPARRWLESRSSSNYPH